MTHIPPTEIVDPRDRQAASRAKLKATKDAMRARREAETCEVDGFTVRPASNGHGWEIHPPPGRRRGLPGHKYCPGVWYLSTREQAIAAIPRHRAFWRVDDRPIKPRKGDTP